LGDAGRAVGIGAGVSGLLGVGAETISGALDKAVTSTVIRMCNCRSVPEDRRRNSTRRRYRRVQRPRCARR